MYNSKISEMVGLLTRKLVGEMVSWDAMTVSSTQTEKDDSDGEAGSQWSIQAALNGNSERMSVTFSFEN